MPKACRVVLITTLIITLFTTTTYAIKLQVQRKPFSIKTAITPPVRIDSKCANYAGIQLSYHWQHGYYPKPPYLHVYPEPYPPIIWPYPPYSPPIVIYKPNPLYDLWINWLRTSSLIFHIKAQKEQISLLQAMNVRYQQLWQELGEIRAEIAKLEKEIEELKQKEEKAPPFKCPKCGKEMEPTWEYCPYDSTPLERPAEIVNLKTQLEELKTKDQALEQELKNLQAQIEELKAKQD